MKEPLHNMSRWAKLSIAGFVLGGCYFAILGLNATNQWWLLGLLLTFVIISGLLALQKTQHSLQHIMLAVLYLICGVLTLFIHQHIAMLYLAICLIAIETLGKRTAMLWVSICVLTVFAIEFIGAPSAANLQDALVNSLLTLFLSGFAFLRVDAEEGRRATRQLLYELEDKNLQLARFAAEEQERLRMQERQHLSRELHDTLGHTLTTSIVQLEAAEKLFEQDPVRVKRVLSTTRDLLKSGLHETRNIVHLLDQSTTPQQSLVKSITQIVTSFETATGLSVSFQAVCDETSVTILYKQYVLRIVQEALTNISRHANASDVTIRLVVEDSIELVIEDNGKSLSGREGQSLPTIKSIDSRVSELKGELSFTRENPLTTLRVQIPIINIEANHSG